MKSLNAAGRLYSHPWPEAALNLSRDVTGTGLPDLVQATDKPVIQLYRQVSELMSRLLGVLGDFEDSNKDVQPVRELLVTNLKSVNAPKTVSASSIQELEEALQKLNNNDVDGAIKLLQVSLMALQPASGSTLTTIVLGVVIRLQSTVASIQDSVATMIKNTNAGTYEAGPPFLSLSSCWLNNILHGQGWGQSGASIAITLRLHPEPQGGMDRLTVLVQP